MIFLTLGDRECSMALAHLRGRFLSKALQALGSESLLFIPSKAAGVQQVRRWSWLRLLLGICYMLHFASGPLRYSETDNFR